VHTAAASNAMPPGALSSRASGRSMSSPRQLLCDCAAVWLPASQVVALQSSESTDNLMRATDDKSCFAIALKRTAWQCDIDLDYLCASVIVGAYIEHNHPSPVLWCAQGRAKLVSVPARIQHWCRCLVCMNNRGSPGQGDHIHQLSIGVVMCCSGLRNEEGRMVALHQQPLVPAAVLTWVLHHG
jgi:hypothetical protein